MLSWVSLVLSISFVWFVLFFLSVDFIDYVGFVDLFDAIGIWCVALASSVTSAYRRLPSIRSMVVRFIGFVLRQLLGPFHDASASKCLPGR